MYCGAGMISLTSCFPWESVYTQKLKTKPSQCWLKISKWSYDLPRTHGFSFQMVRHFDLGAQLFFNIVPDIQFHCVVLSLIRVPHHVQGFRHVFE